MKENEYYKEDLLPTMRAKSQEMQRKFKDFDAERKALIAANQDMALGNKSDNEQLEKLRKAHSEIVQQKESLETQITTLRLRFDE